jgi:transcriptional antiterminator NusG
MKLVLIAALAIAPIAFAETDPFLAPDSGATPSVGDTPAPSLGAPESKDPVLAAPTQPEAQAPLPVSSIPGKTVEKRSFPGYVFVQMIVSDESWYVVRNTPNVTGFLGSGTRPTAMPQSEIDSIKARMAKDEPEHMVDLAVDDLVRINDGPLKGYEGKITEVDAAKGKIKISVSMFGRETPVNLDFLQVKKI